MASFIVYVYIQFAPTCYKLMAFSDHVVFDLFRPVVMQSFVVFLQDVFFI